MTEFLLLEKMAEHYWLSNRAVRLQEASLGDEKQFALYLRYQTTNDRGFHNCINTLLKLRAEKRKAEIGFECGTCKIRTIGSGQVALGTSFGDADKALRCEAAA